MLSSMTSFTNFKMKKEQIKFLVQKAVGDSMSNEQMSPNLCRCHTHVQIQTGNSCELFIPQSGIKPSLS